MNFEPKLIFLYQSAHLMYQLLRTIKAHGILNTWYQYLCTWNNVSICIKKIILSKFRDLYANYWSLVLSLCTCSSKKVTEI